MSAQHKNINNTKLDKSIQCNKSCDSDKVNFGTSTFSEDIRLTASWSCRENSCFGVCIHALNDEIVTGDCPGRRCFSMFVRVTMTPAPSPPI